MKVGWLADDPGYVGGAELTQKAFRRAAPEGVEVIDCPPGGVVSGIDLAVIHNCVSYSPAELGFTVPTFKYWHDVGSHLSNEQWRFLDNAQSICVSPLQARKLGLDCSQEGPGRKFYSAAVLIPPAVNLEPFRKAAESAGERSGAVAVGPWMNAAKNPGRAAEWAQGNGGIDFIGGGPFAPADSKQVPYEDLPEVLARYQTFVHLPSEIEPFGRSTVEAWAAGCELVLNKNVGAKYWIEEAPEKLESAQSDFWSLVLS